MITSADLLHLPYTHDLTEGGIAYALRSLPYLYHRISSAPYERIRRMVAGAAVELAFRRYLSEQNILFEVKGAMPFTEHERYDVSLHGRPCEMKTFLISHRDQISQLRQDPQILLSAPALVASDQHAGDGHSSHALYLFAFVCGLIAEAPSGLQKAIENGLPCYLVHVMPESWSRPSRWNPLGRILLKSEAEEKITVEIGGQDEGREMRSCTVELPPRTRVEIEDRFFSLSYVHINCSPRARIGIHCASSKETHLISSIDWGNLWIDGMDIFLTGYIAREEFSRRASFIQAGSHVFQYHATHVKNLAVPMSELKPLSELLSESKHKVHNIPSLSVMTTKGKV
jgi:hypothetical protein